MLQVVLGQALTSPDLVHWPLWMSSLGSTRRIMHIPRAWLMEVGASFRWVFMLTRRSAVKGFRDELGEYAGPLPHQSIFPLAAVVAASQHKATPQTGP